MHMQAYADIEESPSLTYNFSTNFSELLFSISILEGTNQFWNVIVITILITGGLGLILIIIFINLNFLV